MNAAVIIRPLRAADVPALAGVLARAYRSKQDFAGRLRAYPQLERAATFVAELAGVPVGMVVGNDYGPLAYIAQMAVDPPLGRTGIGTQLMRGLSAWLDERGFIGTELDATPAGAPLYERFAFTDAGETAVYVGAKRAAALMSVRPYLAADRSAILQADAHAFGGDRSEVVDRLIGEPHNSVFVHDGEAGAAPDGYAVAQLVAGRIGPLVAPTVAAAGSLLDAARATFAGPHEVSIPAQNEAMCELLDVRGYRLERRLRHMLRGSRPPAARERLYARMNLGQG